MYVIWNRDLAMHLIALKVTACLRSSTKQHVTLQVWVSTISSTVLCNDNTASYHFSAPVGNFGRRHFPFGFALL